MSAGASTDETGRDRPSLVLASSFTAEPVAPALAFWDDYWRDEIHLDLSPVFAPYNQIYQELLNPDSRLNRNYDGLNVVLLRFEDWFRYLDGEGDVDPASLPPYDAFAERIQENVEEFVDAVEEHKNQNLKAAPLLVALCPPSPQLIEKRSYRRFADDMAERLIEAVNDVPGTYGLHVDDFSGAYPVREYYDLRRDEIGHIPYTPRYYHVLGTILARAAYSLFGSPFKVLCLDCDNTLWNGVCGEDGPHGVEVSPSYRDLHQTALRQKEQGMLLTLNSKNAADDVWEVFAKRSDLPLSREDITDSKINWDPKSKNILEMAGDLNLGLDSFLFLDDNPVEIAEVSAACPQVLALEVPDDPDRIPKLLDHIWAFDRLATTAEDRKRTRMYKDNKKRQQSQDAQSFQAFIDSLDLQIDVGTVTPERLPRVAQLTQRTNQFNFTTVRRTEAEVQALTEQDGWDCRVAEVEDRFGEYGLVGVVFTKEEADCLRAETFLLSCRVLGRGVEHALVAELGAKAQALDYEWVRIDFRPTDRNEPAQRFLEATPYDRIEDVGELQHYWLRADDAASFSFEPTEDREEEFERIQNRRSKDPTASDDADVETPGRNARLAHIVEALSSVDAIVDAIEAFETTDEPALACATGGPAATEASDDTGDASEPDAAREVDAPDEPPMEEAEEADETALRESTLAFLQTAFSDVLDVDRRDLDPDAHFESFGLTSFAIVEITVRIEDDVGRVPKTLLFEHTTLSGLADALIDAKAGALARHFGMSNDAVTASDTASEDAASESPSETPTPSPASRSDVAERRGDESDAAPTSAPVPTSAPAVRTRSDAVEPIAIVGLSGRFPKSSTLQEFWDNLKAGRDCITEVPSDRWDHGKFYDPSGESPDTAYTRSGGFVDRPDAFDPLFFRMSPKEAEQMDPQQRLFLEVAYEAIEDAGHTRASMGTDVGVYVGIMGSDYNLFSAEGALQGTSPYPTEAYQIANRVSYFFDFTGPSTVVDTACSSSGVALHQACRAIRSGDCEAAVTGGVNLIFHPTRHVQYSQMTMLSPKGRCATFGAEADGFVMGEGAGAVVLKPLHAAERDGDHCYGIIRGSAVNADGHTSGFTVPNPDAQAALIRSAQEEAGVDPRTISYVEAHGTGTELGDPIEVRGLTKAFGTASGEATCALGSVKTNVGHLEPAAATVGLAKILMQLKHGELAPSLNADELNPLIDFENTPFRVQRDHAPWPRPRVVVDGEEQTVPRRAGLSSFGAGGVNAHVIVEEYPAPEPDATEPRDELFVFSGRTERDRRAVLTRFRDFLADRRDNETASLPSLSDAAYTLQVGREARPYRAAVVADTVEVLLDRLNALLEDGPDAGALTLQGRADGDDGLGAALDGDEGAAFLDALITNRKLQTLGRLWVDGAEVEWGGLHADRTPRRVSLPTYPFNRKALWIPDVDAPSLLNETPRLHPLVHRNVSTLHGIAYETTLSRTAFYLRDHVVGETPTLPGAAYLELIRAAASEARPRATVCEVGNVVWLAPIAVADQKTIHTVLRADDESVRVRVQSGDEECAQAVVRYADSCEVDRPAPLDVDAIKRRCSVHRDAAAIYRSLSARRFDYGPSFQALREHWTGTDEAVARLQRQNAVADDGEAYRLPPSLVDAAFQAMNVGHDVDGTFVPFALDRLDVWEAIPDTAFAHVQFAPSSREDVVQADLRVTRADGVVCAAFTGMTMKRQPTPDVRDRVGMYVPDWESTSPAPVEPDGTVLFVDTNEERAAQLRNASAWTNATVVTAVAGATAEGEAPAFTFDSQEPQSLHRVVAQLPDAAPLTVVDVRGASAEPSWKNDADLATLCRSTLDAAFHLTRGVQAARDDARILHVNTGPEAVRDALVGFARSVRQEASRLRPSVVDPGRASRAADLLARVEHETTQDDVSVSYRGGERRVRTFRPADAPDGALPVQTGGTYLITGGLGGLGRLFARHLAEAYDANLVLVGRSDRSEKQAALRELQDVGASVRYVQADVTSEDDVETAVEVARETFGALNGVLHAAGVVSDAYLKDTSPDAFHDVLAPKVQGTYVLDRVTRDLPLDCFVLFSSIESVFGNAGQTAYSAANAFMDAFARQRRRAVRDRHRSGVTQAINWPHWADGGMQVDPSIKKLIASTRGTESLGTSDGLRAFEHALCIEEAQVIVTVGETDAIESALGVRSTTSAASSRSNTSPDSCSASSDEDGGAARDDATTESATTESGGGHAFTPIAGDGSGRVEAPSPDASSGRPETASPAASATAPESSSESGSADPLSEAELYDALVDALVGHVSELLKISEEHIDATTDVDDYGFDSIAVTKLANRLNEHFDLTLTPPTLFEHPTLEGLADVLVERHRDSVARVLEPARTEGASPTSASATSSSGRTSGAPSPRRPSGGGDGYIPKAPSPRRSNETRSDGSDGGGEDDEDDTDDGPDDPSGDDPSGGISAGGPSSDPSGGDGPAGGGTGSNGSRRHAGNDRPDAGRARGSAESSNGHRPNPSQNGRDRTDRRESVAAPERDAPQPNASSDEPIAVVGMAGRFPKSPDLSAYWQNFVEGVDCVTEIPETRWDWRDHYGDPTRDRNATDSKWGGFLDDVDAFDAAFFNVSPMEARLMDPQQRLFLETTWHAIENAGYRPETLAETTTGLFVGVTLNDYYELIHENGVDLKAQVATGNINSIVPNRISYLLDFNGPSEPIDTACSSSLVSIHRAITALRTGDCDVAVAGGVHVMVSPTMNIAFSNAGMLSPEGRCKTFDESADGYVRGEGVGAVLLKPLSDARADGDTVHAVIRGSAVNHGGRAKSLTAPNPESQSRVIETAHRRADVDPDTVTYVEAHGTGTELGDPIEVEALHRAFARRREHTGQSLDSPGYCGLGTAKSNLGHLEAAAGIAGVLKVILAMKAETLPPTLHFESLNPYIDLDDSPFRIVDHVQPWTRRRDERGRDIPRRAAVSAFGFGGVNAHVVLEEGDAGMSPAPADPEPQVVVLSARTDAQLQAQAEKMWIHLNRCEEEGTSPPLSDLAYTLQVGRTPMTERLACVVSSLETLRETLRAVANGRTPRSVHRGSTHQTSRVERTSARAETDRLIAERRLDDLARVWVDGQDVDWSRLHDADRQRIPLPGYPFERTRYWLPDASASEPSASSPDAEASTPDEADALSPPRVDGASSVDAGRRVLKPAWRAAGSTARRPSTRWSGRYVLLVNDATYVDVVRDAGAMDDVDWIVVREEAEYPTLVSPEYEIDRADAASGRAAAQALLDAHAPIDGIVDAADVYREPSTTESVPWGRVALLQALVRRSLRDGLTLAHVSCGRVPHQTDAPTAHGSIAASLTRTLAAEHDAVNAVTVDLPPTHRSTDASFGRGIFDAVRREMGATETLVDVCHRDGIRFQPRLESRSFDVHPDDGHLGPYRIDPEGVYVVTGGTGGLGSRVAHELADAGARRLVLTGVTPIPDASRWDAVLRDDDADDRVRQKIRRIRDLERNGVDVTLFTGSLSERRAVEAAIDRVRETQGPIRGLIHCAGWVSHDNPALVHKPREQMEATLEPKVAGLNALADVLDLSTLDFTVLYSSVSAVVPALGAGVGDYAAANAYLNGFAAAHAPTASVQAVCWPSWSGTGMGAVTNERYRDLGFRTHDSDEGTALLHATLKHTDAPWLLPAVVDPDVFQPQRLCSLPSEGDPTPANESPDRSANASEASSRDDALHERVRERIAAVFATELMLDADRMDPGTPFAEYGVDSILIAQLVPKLEDVVGVSLDPSIILSHPTIDRLCAHVLENHRETVADRLGTDAAHVPRDSADETESDASTRDHAEASDSAVATRRASTSQTRRRGEDDETSQHVAVVGVGCHLPGASDADAFWSNLRNGVNSIREVPSSRWSTEALYSPEHAPGRTVSKWGGFLDGIESFDPEYFDIPERDAPHVDPLIRQTLECTVQAVRNAGYEREDVWGDRVGVYFGSGTSSYSSRIQVPVRGTATGTNQNFIAALLAHHYNWSGPNLTLDSACSSSLVSVHLACQALAAGDCDVAVAGGADLLLNESPYLQLSAAQALSPDGQCRPFDENANGIVLGEGCVVVLLKPLADALDDGDRVYAVVESTAVNNDGHTMGLTTPNLDAQQDVIRTALDRADVDPSTIGMMEAHGTGTMIGDPIELRALTNVFRDFTDDDQFCAVGSVKSNIGHLLMAAGITGFLKVVLALNHGYIPPTLNIEQTNPRFEFGSSPFYPALDGEAWTPRRGLRRAALSSFGFGGTNAHAILRGFDSIRPDGYAPSRSPLPPVAFDRKRYWVDAPPTTGPAERPADARADSVRSPERGLLTLEEA